MKIKGKNILSESEINGIKEEIKVLSENDLNGNKMGIKFTF